VLNTTMSMRSARRGGGKTNRSSREQVQGGEGETKEQSLSSRLAIGLTESEKKNKLGYHGPAVQVADVYSNKALVKPTWLRVTTTPWHGAMVSTGGYGRKVDDTSVSLDSPDFFHIPAVIQHNPATALGTQFRKRQGLTVKPMKTATSDDAPDWFKSTRQGSGRRNRSESKHAKLILGSQVICEPILDERKVDEIDFATAR